MESRAFRQPRREHIDLALLEAHQRLTPEERLDAFLTHSRLMMELYQAGAIARATPRSKSKSP